MELPLALVLAQRAVLNEAHSALPNAPVVTPTLRRRPGDAARRRLAAGLDRAARAVAPAAPSCAS